MRISTKDSPTRGNIAMISPIQSRRPRRLISERRPTKSRPNLECLENRNLLSVTISKNFQGLSLTGDSSQVEPPDPIAAAGLDNGNGFGGDIVEMVNTDLGIYTKAGGLLSRVPLKTLFLADSSLSFSDPQVTFDEHAGQFFVGILAYNISSDINSQVSHFDYATLDGTNPSTVLSTNYLDVKESSSGRGATGTTGVPLLADFPRVGWNASAYFVSFNMFEFTGSQSFDHVQIVTINQSTMGKANTVDAPSGQDFTIVPAVMHDLTATNEWFVEEHGFDNGRQLQVIQMVNVLSSTPSLGSAYVNVPTYGMPYSAPQPGGFSAPKINTGDTRILSAAVRGSDLVATQNVGTGGATHARWYDINLNVWNGTNNTDALYQSGDINPGKGIYTYYPAIDIDAHSNLGLTYMQSSKNQYMSMYVTGRAATDPTGKVQTPVLVQGGLGTYFGSRAGDYSGLSVDPSTGTFWAASEYSRGGSNYWGTAVANFSVSAGGTLLTASSVQGGSGTSSSTTDLTGLPISPLDAAVDQLYPSDVMDRDKSHLIRWKILASLGND
jgi:hypothetical protein